MAWPGLWGADVSDRTPRKIAFILAATDHGTMIVNRFDHHTDQQGRSDRQSIIPTRNSCPWTSLP